MAASPESFSAFYDEHHERVLHATSLIVGPPARSARIARESFVRTHAAWGRTGADRALAATMRNVHRLASRVASGADADDLRGLGDPDDLDDAELRSALGGLARPARCMVVLRHLLDLDDRTIAWVMSRPEVEVVAELDLAHAQLCAALGEDRTGVA